MALGLTQQEFADIFGRTKRTVHRWEERGTLLLPSEAAALARALYPVRPDLAAEIAATASTTLDRLGLAPAPTPSKAPLADPIDAVVRAAAEVMGVAAEAIRPALAAAFVRASEAGLDVKVLAEKLKQRETV
jgi:hypothetical protein